MQKENGQNIFSQIYICDIFFAYFEIYIKITSVYFRNTFRNIFWNIMVETISIYYFKNIFN